MTDEPIVGLPERLGLSGEFQPLIEGQLRILSAMILPNGAVLASPNAGYRARRRAVRSGAVCDQRLLWQQPRQPSSC